MNRIISLSVEDMYIKYTGEAIGATGSHNAVTLRITFGPAWEGTAKTAYFTDALGNASVALVLGLDTLVDGAYEVNVPSEALKTAGVATITIKGVLVSGETTTKAITTAAGHFRVLDSELPDSAGDAGTITPSDKEQLQAEIAGMETLFTTAKAAAEAAAANAKVSETNAKGSETAAASSASSAEASKTAAAESAATATAKASAAGESAAKAAASQTAAKSSETAAKVSETAAKTAQTGAETAESSAQNSAAAAAGSAQTAQSAASTATNAASSANQAAASASGSASQASAAATAAAGSATGAETASKTAQSWAVGGTGTRPGEDTDNAKYWAQQAEAVAGGDFATKVEAQGYVTAHNQSAEAHIDIRNDLNGKEASGTAAAAVTAHNKDTSAHADIREDLAGKEAAGAAAAVQRNLTAHAGNTTVHVTSAEKTAWNGSVRYDAAQSLKDTQKTQARNNIGATTALLTDKNLHVAKTGSDTTGDGSEAKPFLTIGAALKSLPKILVGNATITVHEGTYDEAVYPSGFSGNGDLEIKGESGKTVSVRTFYIHDNACGSTKLTNLTVFGSSGDGYNWSVFCDHTSPVYFSNITCANTVASQFYGAFRFSYMSFATLEKVTVSNKAIALDVCAATVYLRSAVTGTGNTVAIRCGSAWGNGGGIVQKGECSLAGEEQKGFGGQIW